jgi:hypothetical protein
VGLEKEEALATMQHALMYYASANAKLRPPTATEAVPLPLGSVASSVLFLPLSGVVNTTVPASTQDAAPYMQV